MSVTDDALRAWHRPDASVTVRAADRVGAVLVTVADHTQDDATRTAARKLAQGLTYDEDSRDHAPIHHARLPYVTTDVGAMWDV